MKKRSVIWTQNNSKSLDKFCEFIAEDSPSAAKIVKTEIINTTRLLSITPEMFQADEYFTGKDKYSEIY